MAEEKRDFLGEQFLARQSEIVKSRQSQTSTSTETGWHANAVAQPQEQKPFDTRTVRDPETQPKRLVKPELPKPESIKSDLDTLISDLEVCRKEYSELSLDVYYRPQREAQAKVDALREQLAQAEAELEQATLPHPHQVYRSFVESSEAQISQRATLLIEVLTNEAANKQFGVNADRLPADTKKALSLRFQDRLRKYGPFFASTHRLADVSDERLTKRIGELIEAAQRIIEENL
jgi:hypothetical protein